MKVSASSRAVAVVSAAALGGLALTIAPSASAASGGNVTIGNTQPKWLAKAHTKNSAARVPAAAMTARVYLNPKGGLDALKAEVAALSDPRSSQYRHWLTPAQYRNAYGPTTAAVKTVTDFARSKGLKVTGVEAQHRYVTVSGTPAQLGKAFNVALGSYTHDGHTVVAPDRAASVPAAVAADVLTITGLDTTPQLKKHNSVRPDVTPPAGFRNARPCAVNYGMPLATFKADFKTRLPKFQGQTLPYAPCGYTGPSFRAAYEGNSTLDGSGVTVAITDAYAWQHIATDANTYAERNGDGSYTSGQLTQVLPGSYNRQAQCDPSGWSGEETLDVEAVHAMAPGAKIRYYASPSCFDDDFLATLAKVVDDNKASIVTNSWSDLEGNESAANVAAYEQVFLQGAMQGVSFLFSSGDNGDELANTGIKQVDYPASDPYVTGAGGTATGIAYGDIVTQTGWGTRSYALSPNGKRWVDTGFLYGAGGGFSALFNRPSWQTRIPVGSPAGRAVPDIAMDADPNTGMLIGQTQKFPDGTYYDQYRIGGTSLASPLLAGMMALANQSAGGRLGWLNPLLYAAPKALITDVTPVKDLGVVRVNYNNSVDPTDGLSYFVRTFDQDSSLKTAKGWDPVTGLGVPNPAFLKAVAR